MSSFITCPPHRFTAEPDTRRPACMCVITEADNATAKSAWKQKNKSSTIKINRTMSKEIFVASRNTESRHRQIHRHGTRRQLPPQRERLQCRRRGLRRPTTQHPRTARTRNGLIDSSTYFKALACDHFRRIKKNAYTIVKSNAVNALDDAESMIATEDVKPDVVFFDMPGTPEATA